MGAGFSTSIEGKTCLSPGGPGCTVRGKHLIVRFHYDQCAVTFCFTVNGILADETVFDKPDFAVDLMEIVDKLNDVGLFCCQFNEILPPLGFHFASSEYQQWAVSHDKLADYYLANPIIQKKIQKMFEQASYEIAVDRNYVLE